MREDAHRVAHPVEEARAERAVHGEPRLADNAMVALALLIAESEPAQKELMIRLVLNLLEDGQ